MARRGLRKDLQGGHAAGGDGSRVASRLQQEAEAPRPPQQGL